MIERACFITAADKPPNTVLPRPKVEAGLRNKPCVRSPLPEGLKGFGRVADDAPRRGASNGDVRRFRSLQKPWPRHPAADKLRSEVGEALWFGNRL